MECPTCGFVARPGDHYCGMCGTRLTQTCPICGDVVPYTYHFCSRCGAQLTPGAAADVQVRSAAVRTPTTVSVDTQPPPPQGPAFVPGVRQNDALLAGERRVATIILADVQGSTDLLEKVGSERWVEMMNHVFRLLEAEIYRFGGTVDQFRGDGLVAFFGTTVAHEDDPERGVLAALAMQRTIRTYAIELARREGIDLSLRVGVNTGEVIVANVGDDQTHSEDTAMGEAIALAARMEQAAEADTVLVSENTHRLVESQFDWLALGEIFVKGISHPVSVYRPLASRLSPEQSQEYDVVTPLIGREAELEELVHCVDELREGRGGIVVVTGERGIGKSVLLQEFRRNLTRQEALLAEVSAAESLSGSTEQELLGELRIALKPGARTKELRGRARSYDQSQPYAMWHDLMQHWLGVRKDESRESIRDRLREQAEALWGENMAEVYPDLAKFLGLPLEPSFAEQIRRLDAEGQRQRLFLAVRRWVEALTRQGPIIINFNDMHWADATSLDLLRYCLPLCDYLELLWLFVFRPERGSVVWDLQHDIETEYPHRLTTVTLEPFGVEESRALLDHMIGPDVLPDETMDLIIQRAEGNPFYTQELVRSLIADGVLVREAITNEEGESVEAWRATQAVTTLSLPDSLQGLLMARIDRLGAVEQQILQRAAVIGSIFWSNVLQAITPDFADLRTPLTSLQRSQLIAERGRGPDLGVEYIFESKLIRDAAYDSLLSSQRTVLHLQIAEYLEAVCELDSGVQDQGLYLGALAYHYRNAKRPEKELTFTLRNAERARSIYANAEASQHYTQALRLLDEIGEPSTNGDSRREWLKERFQILLGRHTVYYLMAQFDKMWADARALLPLAREIDGDPALLVDALLHQPGVGDYQNRNEVEAAVPMALEALDLARELNDPVRELESMISVVNQRLALSDPSWQALAEEALDLAREAGQRTYEARLLVGMGGIHAFSDQPERGMEYVEAAAALAMSEGIEDKVVQMALLNLLGLEYERSGDYHRLLTEYQQERLHASREIGHRPMESQALQACGRITGIYLGDYTSALSALEECRHILNGSLDEVYPLFHIAQIQTAQADHVEARSTLDQIEAVGESLPDRGRASHLLVEATFCIAEGARAATRADVEAVEEYLTSAIQYCCAARDLVRSSSLVSEQYEMAACTKVAVAYLGLAQTIPDSQQEYLGLALEAGERAHEIYQTFGYAQIVECVSEEVLFRYSQTLAANGFQDKAQRFLRRAYDELMRKHALIPPDSHYRRTYIEQIPLHREIRAAYAARIGSILTEPGPAWEQVEPSLA